MLLDLRNVSNVGTACRSWSTVSVALRSMVARLTTVTSAGTSRSFSGLRVAVTTISSPHPTTPPSSDIDDVLRLGKGATSWPVSWP